MDVNMYPFMIVGACRTGSWASLEEVNGKLKEISDCCHDIPFLESLQCLLQMDLVREQVHNVIHMYAH